MGKIFNIFVKINEKSDCFLSSSGYFFLLEEAELNIHDLVSLAKKIFNALSLIKDSSIDIDIQLDDNFKIMLINWINFYISFHNRCENSDHKITQVKYLNSSYLELTSQEEDANIVYDFNYMLNLVNNEVHPENFSMHITKYLNKFKIPFTITSIICDENSEFRAIYGVGKSGQYLPRLIKVKINGIDNSCSPEICLIGKGITYDTGGYNVKPWKYMLGMHQDKVGALFALFTGMLAYLKHNISSTILMVVAENKINSLALCPGDIINNYGNKSIQIIHTDAEGRVVLSDAISYACKHIKFKHMLIFSSLTGTASCILGPDTCIVMSNNENISKTVLQESKLMGEYAWYLPLSKWYLNFIQKEHNGVKCIQNSSDLSCADTALAGAFLYNFFDYKGTFTHFDLAPCFEKPLLCSYSSAYFIPTVVSVIKKLL